MTNKKQMTQYQQSKGFLKFFIRVSYVKRYYNLQRTLLQLYNKLKMSEQNDKFPEFDSQNKGKDEESFSGKRKRISKEQAKLKGKDTEKCTECQKKYLSYPALYKHCKDKHPKLKISSKNMEDKGEDILPIQKMKTLLKETYSSKSQETQRNLIIKIYKCSNKIIEQCTAIQQNFGKTLGKYNKNHAKLAQIKRMGIQFANLNNLDQKIFQYDKVFRKTDGKFAKLSFGDQILSFFVNSNLSYKIYLQLQILQQYADGQKNTLEIEEKIWGRKQSWRWLYNQWNSWRELAEQLQEQKSD